MSVELRHDIPVLLLVVALAVIAIGAPLFEYWGQRRKFDRSVRMAAAATVAVLVCIGGLIERIRLPGSEDTAIYLGIMGGGVVYALGFYARNKIVRVMSWNGWPKTFALRYPIEYWLLPLPIIVAALAAGAAIYEATR